MAANYLPRITLRYDACLREGEGWGEGEHHGAAEVLLHLGRELVDAELLDLVEDLAEGLAQLWRHQVLPADAQPGRGGARGGGQAREFVRDNIQLAQTWQGTTELFIPLRETCINLK